MSCIIMYLGLFLRSNIFYTIILETVLFLHTHNMKLEISIIASIFTFHELIAPVWGLSYDFSDVSPNHGLQFFMDCSSRGLFQRFLSGTDCSSVNLP